MVPETGIEPVRPLFTKRRILSPVLCSYANCNGNGNFHFSSEIKINRPSKFFKIRHHSRPNWHQTGTTIMNKIAQLNPGKFLTLQKVRYGGALQARKLTGGTSFYWRYTFNGKTDRVLVGQYDSSAPPRSTHPTKRGTFSIVAAEIACEAMALKHWENLHHGGYRALVEVAALGLERNKDIDPEPIPRAPDRTLNALLAEYCGNRKDQGRESHSDARCIFRLHVTKAFPEIANRAANTTTAEEVANMMRKLVEVKKNRTADKLRSYLRSAYEFARTAPFKATIPARFKEFDVRHNPVAETVPVAKTKSAKNPLTKNEMLLYWQLISGDKSPRAAMLRLHLLTGGQRIRQLAQLRTENISENMIVIFDKKGRNNDPTDPRRHAVPLTKDARLALEQCTSGGEFALSAKFGTTPLGERTLSNGAKEIVGDAIAGFNLKRIRSTIETTLASQGVSKDTRGRLQSHGIFGVQDKHYDDYDYFSEKLEALNLISLTFASSQV